MNNRKQLLQQVEAAYQQGMATYAADNYEAALYRFMEAKDLLETIPENEYDDHEYRELGRNYNNMGVCCQRLSGNNREDINEANAVIGACYKKAAILWEKIINKTPEDAERIDRNRDATRLNESIINGFEAMNRLLDLVALFAEGLREIEKNQAEEEEAKNKSEASPASPRP